MHSPDSEISNLKFDCEQFQLKFDNVLYPAITFCNLNPYKRSLIRLVPSVKDTMDVYENAKWMSKKNRQNRPRTDSLSYGAVEDKLKVLELFKDEILQAYHESGHQDDHSTNSSMKLNERDGAKNIPTDEFNQQILDQNVEMNQNQRFRKEPAIWLNQETSRKNSDTQHHRSRREEIIKEQFDHYQSKNTSPHSCTSPLNLYSGVNMIQIPRRRYEAIEAHCKCIGTMDMECIRFESVPLSNDAKCICTFDREMNVAWPCFNISVWQDEECPICAEDGHCEPKSNENVISVNWPCMCRRRQSDTVHNLFIKPYCIAKRMNILKLWTAHPDWEQNEMHWPSSTTSTTTTTTSTPSTTLLPSTEDDEYRRKKNQSARVSAPETVKAMGFTGMTDGVAMLTRAKENLIFTMSALSKMQRIALSHSKRDFIEMCSFDGKQCDIDKDFKLHVDPEFGNCYTFNWGINNNYTSSRAGPMYGIRILLFVNISDYMATSESTGVRIAVHSPTEFPFPDTFGYSAPIGFASSFGLRKQVVKKLGAPYGDCEVRKKMNSSWYIYSDYDYNPEGCHRSCFQNVLLEKCGCGDPRFPVPKGLKHCSAFNASARACLERSILEVGDFHHLTTDLQDCECRQPCEHESFTVTFSTSKWPSNINDVISLNIATTQ
ncbi:unnamed protein product [Anisakis simplex]|uniref:Uncharacterized protein n=1 Tax=Anisakis simplex TaxID=6269 RepID=A0A3P6RUL8_ANISI|nr:unnamed protein product [Anisakis simplex]